MPHLAVKLEDPIKSAATIMIEETAVANAIEERFTAEVSVLTILVCHKPPPNIIKTGGSREAQTDCHHLPTHRKREIMYTEGASTEEQENYLLASSSLD